MSDTDNQWPNGDGELSRPALSRTVLGVLLALLILAVIVALWALLTGGDDDVADEVDITTAAVPTALPIPTSTPAPQVVVPDDAPTPTPTPEPTPLPEGFEACGDDRSPLLSATYIVDTLSTPLNQRNQPAVDGELMGTFAPAQSGLVFSGDCVVNLADGYVWWENNNGTNDVWVASRFVSPN